MKKKNLMLILLCMFVLTGCTKTLKDEDNKIVRNELTGQNITENIICKPTDEHILNIYSEHEVSLEELPKCSEFTPLSKYEGLWTSLFVKPLAWVIIKIGMLVKNYGLALIITCFLLRLILYPLTRKTAMQSELIKKAQPELTKLEKKYANKTTPEDQNRKAQEMMMIYQKYQINPISGCLLSFVQLPLLFIFYEAINRTPAIFEDKFLFLELGKTPGVAITNGQWYYIILVALIILATYISFRKTLKDQTAQGQSMKMTLYIMLALITVSSFSMASGVGIYWVASNIFTIAQNLIVERKKAK